MPKTTGISSTPAENSDTAQIASIALFSGVGLLISLIVVILRINGVLVIAKRLPSRLMTAAAPPRT